MRDNIAFSIFARHKHWKYIPTHIIVMKIIFATGNKNKLHEAQMLLGEGITLATPAQMGLTEDIPETHDTIEGNAIEKAMYVWNKLKVNCFSDDTGLEVDALNGAPGVYSARYAGPEHNAIANNAKLLKQLEGVPDAERTARFRCVVAYIEDGEINTFEGVLEGHINHAPVGLEGFGYDVIFVPEGYTQTLAELRLEEKNAISHRGKALEKFQCYLQTNHKL